MYSESDGHFRSLWQGLVAGAILLAAETAIGAFVLDRQPTDVVMVYLLGVVLVATRFGYVPSLLTAGASVAAFDFFFTSPLFSFAVSDRRYVLTFAIMFFVAFVISNRTEWIRRIASAAGRREVRTAALYAMSRELAVARSRDEMIRVASRHLHQVFQSEVCLRLTDDGGVQLHASGAPETGIDGTRVVPLQTSTGSVGALTARPTDAGTFEAAAHRELLDTFASQIALAIERVQLAEQAQSAEVEVRNERLRNALLSSVSHDLRTPLAVIKGAVTALLLESPGQPPERRGEYLTTISDEASRMNRLIRNLLSMTSLEAGALRVRNKEWQPLEEVIGVALNRLDEQLRDRLVHVEIGPEASLAPFDAILLEQVLVNLIENAVKYAPRSSPISITARRTGSAVEIGVTDAGPGVPPGEEESVFDKFHRAARTSSGMGLGLTICRGIVGAHGGELWYAPGQGGGASFRFVLPLDESGPPATVLPDAVGDP